MASPLRNANPLLGPRTPIDYDPLQEGARPTAAEYFGATTSPEADFIRGLRTAEYGLEAGSFYRRADQAQDAGDEVRANRLRQQGDEAIAATQHTTPRVGSHTQVNSVGDAIDFAQAGAGQLAPTMGPPLAAGAAGALAGAAVAGPFGIAPGIAAAVGGSAAAAYPSFYMNAEEQASAQQADPYLRENTTARERLHEQNVVGAQNAALDVILPGVIGARLVGGAARRIAGQALKKSPLRRTLAVARETAIEAGTEGAQALTGQAGLGRLNPNRDTSHDMTEFIDSLILGALGGGGVSLGTTVPGYLTEKVGQKLESEADRGAVELGGAVRDLELGLQRRAAQTGEDVELRPSLMIDKLSRPDAEKLNQLGEDFVNAKTPEQREAAMMNTKLWMAERGITEDDVVEGDQNTLSRQTVNEGRRDAIRVDTKKGEPTSENPDINMLDQRPVPLFPESTEGAAKFTKQHVRKGEEKTQLLKWKRDGFLSASGVDSVEQQRDGSIGKPLGDWLQERDAAPEEVQAEVDSMLRDIDRRLKKVQNSKTPKGVRQREALEAEKAALEEAGTYGDYYKQLNNYTVLRFPPSEIEGNFTPQDAAQQQRSSELVAATNPTRSPDESEYAFERRLKKEKAENRKKLYDEQGIQVNIAKTKGKVKLRWVFKEDVAKHARKFFRQELKSFPDGPAREEAALFMGAFADPRVKSIVIGDKEITQKTANLENPEHRAALKLAPPERGYAFGKKPKDPLSSRDPEDQGRGDFTEEQSDPFADSAIEDPVQEMSTRRLREEQRVVEAEEQLPIIKEDLKFARKTLSSGIHELELKSIDVSEFTSVAEDTSNQIKVKIVKRLQWEIKRTRNARNEAKRKVKQLTNRLTRYYDETTGKGLVDKTPVPVTEDNPVIEGAKPKAAEPRRPKAPPVGGAPTPDKPAATKSSLRPVRRPVAPPVVGTKPAATPSKPASVPRGTSKVQPTTKQARTGVLNIYAGANQNKELSNLAPRPFTFGRDPELRTYQSVEHAYQTWKSGTFAKITYNNPRWKTPYSKIRGSKLANHKVSEQIMEEAIRESFEQNSAAAAKLAATGDAVLTHTQDRTIWKQKFPEILTKIRNEFKGTEKASTASLLTTNVEDVQALRDEVAELEAAQKLIKQNQTLKPSRMIKKDEVANQIQYGKWAKSLREKGLKIVEEDGEYWVVDKDGKRLEAEVDKLKRALDGKPTDEKYATREEAMADPANKEGIDEATKWMIRAFGPEIVDKMGWMLAREGPQRFREAALDAGDKAAADQMDFVPALAGFYDGYKDFMMLAADSIDPLGHAFHEGMHKFVKTLRDSGNPKVYERLVKAATAPHVMNQMKRLLKDYPQAIDQLHADPEEAVAYAFQFYAASRLPGGPEFHLANKRLFARVIDTIKKILGIMTNASASEQIFDALYEGRVQRDGIAPLKRFEERAFKAYAKDVMQAIRGSGLKALSSPIIQLQQLTNADGRPIKAFKKLANYWHSEPLKGGKSGLIYRDAQTVGQLRNRWYKILQDHNVTKEEMKASLLNFQSMKPPRNAFEKDLKHFMKRMYAYQFEGADSSNPVKVLRVIDEKTGRKGWVKPGKVENYWSRIWSVENILANEIEFREVMAAEGDLSDEVITNFIEMLQNTNGLEAGSELQQYRADFSPFNAAINARAFEFIKAGNAHKFAKFQEQDMGKVMERYIRQAVHRREHSRTFGHDGGEIEKLFTAARAEGATPEQIAYAEKVVKGLEGRLGTDQVSDMAREAMVGAMSVTNIAVLALALFSSMVDPLGVMVRTGSVKAAGNTFTAGFKQILNDARKAKSKDQEITEYLGIIEEDMAQDLLNNMERGIYMNEKLRKVNKFFFKSIGLEQWTRGTRIGATRAAFGYLKKNADNTKALKELGLTPDQIEIFEDRIKLKPEEFAKNPKKITDADIEKARLVQNAVFRMVDESILRPSAGTRPLWMSDMRFKLLGHLKSYTFTFHNQILRQLAERAKTSENLAQAALVFAPLLSYVPVMLAADMARGMVQDDDRERDWDELLGRAFQRSAVAGMGTFFMDIDDELKWGGLPTNTLLGPVVDNALNLGRTAVSPDASFPGAAAKLLPYNALWRKWGDEDN